MAKIALVQTTTTTEFEDNLAKALEWVDEAAAAGVQVVAFPEVFLFIGGRKGKLEHAQSLDGEVVGRFREAAKRHGMAILLGSIHERSADNGEKVYNTSIWIDAQGEIAATYRQLKLFNGTCRKCGSRKATPSSRAMPCPRCSIRPSGRWG